MQRFLMIAVIAASLISLAGITTLFYQAIKHSVDCTCVEVKK